MAGVKTATSGLATNGTALTGRLERMRMIDADALDSKIESHYKHKKIDRYDHDLLGHYIDVEMAPTIDAEPVRHGRWLRLDEAPEWDQRRCSECGDISCCQRNYCPNCGAKMDGDGDAR